MEERIEGESRAAWQIITCIAPTNRLAVFGRLRPFYPVDPDADWRICYQGCFQLTILIAQQGLCSRDEIYRKWHDL